MRMSSGDKPGINDNLVRFHIGSPGKSERDRPTRLRGEDIPWSPATTLCSTRRLSGAKMNEYQTYHTLPVNIR